MRYKFHYVDIVYQMIEKSHQRNIMKVIIFSLDIRCHNEITQNVTSSVLVANHKHNKFVKFSIHFNTYNGSHYINDTILVQKLAISIFSDTEYEKTMTNIPSLQNNDRISKMGSSYRTNPMFKQQL